MRLVSLPSYPPRGQGRVQEHASPQHLILTHSSSSSSSRGNDKSLRNALGASPNPTDSPSWELQRRFSPSTLFPAHSQEQLFALSEGADISAEGAADTVDLTHFNSLGSWQVVASCATPPLQHPYVGEEPHDAAMVSISRTLSITMLDIIPDTVTGNHITASCGSLLETFGSCGSLMSLGSCGQPSAELMDLTPEDFAALAAELVPGQPLATPLETLASCGSNLAQAVFEALTEVAATHAQLHSHPISFLEDVEVYNIQEDASICAWARAQSGTDAPSPELPLPAAFVPWECSLPDLQDSPPFLSSDEWSDESYLLLMGAGSGLSDARSSDMDPQPLTEQQRQPLPCSACPPAMPHQARSQQGATLAAAGGSATSDGPGVALKAVGSRHRRGRACKGGSSNADLESRVQRNRQLQKEYMQRKRARAAVTHVLAENLQNRVESLMADIEALRTRQDELLGAQEPPQSATQASVAMPSCCLSEVDAINSTPIESDTTDWACLAVDMDVTATQKIALHQLFQQLVSELRALAEKRKQLAQALKSTNPAAMTCEGICTDFTANADTIKEIQCNAEVVSGLQKSFNFACQEVLTGEQLKKLGACAVHESAKVQALCRSLF